MASSFKGVDLFGSGPHRFSEGPAGQQLVARISIGIPTSGSITIGDQELIVTVRGRLVGADDGEVWDQIDDIKAHLMLWNTPGMLIDHQGHVWSSINFVRFEPEDRFDRGRVTSVGYVARFVKLT